jgi:hypothetical protein
VDGLGGGRAAAQRGDAVAIFALPALPDVRGGDGGAGALDVLGHDGGDAASGRRRRVDVHVTSSVCWPCSVRTHLIQRCTK